MPFDDENLAYALTLFRRKGWDDLSDARIEPVISGQSGCSVFQVAKHREPLRYLKISSNEAASPLGEEAARTQWLAARGMRVPTLRRFDNAGAAVLLSDAVQGTAAEISPLATPHLIDALAVNLAALHSLPVADCLFDETLARRLARAAAAVDAGDIDPGEFATRNIDTDPAALLARLVRTQPTQDLVVVHGDATLSNMIVDDNGVVGFVDCGNAGRGDRYLDLAVLADGIEERFGPTAVRHFAKAYGGSAWDAAKARYFLDLYEFF